jgi:uncharacterized membrane protein SirB2
MPSVLPILIAVHVALALALLVPTILLPFALGRRAATELASDHATSRLVRLQSASPTVIGGGLLISGVALVAVVGVELLGQPWLLVALAAYAVNMALAFFIQRPRLRRLVGLGRTDEAWAGMIRRQRYLSYLMAGLVGAIGFLMSTKPALW